MQLVLKSEPTAARRRFYFTAVDATNLQSRLTGVTSWTVYVSLNGATAVAASGSSPTEVDSTNFPGLYYYEATSGELATLGPFLIDIIGRNMSAAMEPRELAGQVVAFDPYDALALGIGALPAVVASASGGLPTLGTGTGQIHVDGSGRVYSLVNAVTTGALAAAAFASDYFTSLIANVYDTSAIEGTLTLRQVLRLVLGGVAGTAEGFATGSHLYHDTTGTKTRIAATVNKSGRTVTALDPS